MCSLNCSVPIPSSRAAPRSEGRGQGTVQKRWLMCIIKAGQGKRQVIRSLWQPEKEQFESEQFEGLIMGR